MAARTGAISIRPATADDIPFLAQMIHEACLPPLNHCAFDDLAAGLGVNGTTFLEAVLAERASAWGNAEDFFILEEDRRPMAAAAGYEPTGAECRPFFPEQLPAVAARLGLTPQAGLELAAAYEAQFEPGHCQEYFKPQAAWIIEYVAVIPEARGRGLIKILLQAVLAEGKARGLPTAGIMIINGNDRARQTYEALGFRPYVAYFEDYFADAAPGFPGITRFRLKHGGKARG